MREHAEHIVGSTTLLCHSCVAGQGNWLCQRRDSRLNYKNTMLVDKYPRHFFCLDLLPGAGGTTGYYRITINPPLKHSVLPLFDY